MTKMSTTIGKSRDLGRILAHIKKVEVSVGFTCTLSEEDNGLPLGILDINESSQNEECLRHDDYIDKQLTMLKT